MPKKTSQLIAAVLFVDALVFLGVSYYFRSKHLGYTMDVLSEMEIENSKLLMMIFFVFALCSLIGSLFFWKKSKKSSP